MMTEESVSEAPAVEPIPAEAQQQVSEAANQEKDKQEPQARQESQAQIAARIKRDREFYKIREEQKQHRRELEELRSFKKAFDQDKYSAFEKYGGDYNEWTSRILNKKKTPEEEIQTVRSEIERLRQEREEEKQSSERRAAQTRQQEALDKFINDVKNYTGSEEASSLEGVRGMGAELLVVQKANDLVSSGESPDIRRAAGLVEEDFEKGFNKLLKSKKYQEIARKELGLKEPQPENGLEDSAKPKTVNNVLAAQAPTRSPRTLTQSERHRRFAHILRHGPGSL